MVVDICIQVNLENYGCSTICKRLEEHTVSADAILLVYLEWEGSSADSSTAVISQKFVVRDAIEGCKSFL